MVTRRSIWAARRGCGSRRWRRAPSPHQPREGVEDCVEVLGRGCRSARRPAGCGAHWPRRGPRDALLLAAGELGRTMLRRSPRPEIAEKLRSPSRPLPAARARGELRQHHILQRGELGQEVVRLVDEPDLVAAHRRALVVRQRHRADLVDIDLAGVGLLQQARRSAAGSICRSRTARSGRRTARPTPRDRPRAGSPARRALP